MRNRVEIWFGISVVLLGTLVSTAYYNERKVLSDESKVTDFRNVISEIGEFELAIAQSESSISDYELSGKLDSLENWRQSKLTTASSLAKLATLTVGNPSQQDRAKTLAALVSQENNIIEALIADYGGNSSNPRHDSELVWRSFTVRKQIVAAANAMRTEERGLLIKEQKAASLSLRRSSSTLILADLASVGLLGPLLIMLRKEAQGRQVAQESFVESVSHLAESELEIAGQWNLLQCVLESIEEALIVADENARFILWNPAAQRILGRGPTDTSVEQWSKYYGFYKADGTTPYPSNELPLARAIRGEAAGPELLCVRRTDLQGETWIYGSAQPLRYATGVLRGGVAVFQGVTEMRNTLIARKKSEETLRLLLESTAEGILAADLEGNCTFCNPAAFRMLGYPNAESILDRNLHTLVHHSRADGTALPESECRIFNTTRVGEFTHVEDEVFWQGSGEAMSVEYWARPIINDGQVTGTVVAFHDITIRKQAQAALEEKTLQLQALFDNARDAVMVQDDSGRFTDVNRAATELFGIPKEDLVGRDIRESMEPGYPFDKLWESFLRTGNHYLGQRILVRPDGKRRVVDVSATANFLPGRHLAIYHDVTEQQELQTQLLQSQKMEAIGRLAGGIAHDFNNLLNVIGGYTEMLQMGLEEGTTQYGYADKVILTTRKAAALTRQLLAFSRKQLLAPAVLDLNPVIKELGKMLPRLIGEDIELILSLDKNLDRVKVDASQLEQVILNLVVNARDAMPNGGKLIIETRNSKLDRTYATSHHPFKAGDYVLITVIDNGVGMSKQVQGRIFEPFFTTKEQGKGTGLGLSTVYGIVKQSNGFIWVYSEEGMGTAFKIYLPAVREPATAANPQIPLEEIPAGTETILLVEDEDFLRTVVGEYLTNSGYTVLEAANGLDALRLSQEYQGHIHLLLTDVVMPKISGRKLATQICNTRSGLDVIYVSGYTEDTIAHHGVLEPGLDFMQKPYTLHSLGQMIRKVLDRKARLMSLRMGPSGDA